MQSLDQVFSLSRRHFIKLIGSLPLHQTMIDPTVDLALCAQERKNYIFCGMSQMLRKEILIEIHTLRLSV